MAKITKVRVLQGYCLELAFDDGVGGVVDLSELVGRGVFRFVGRHSCLRTDSDRFIRRACLGRPN